MREGTSEKLAPTPMPWSAIIISSSLTALEAASISMVYPFMAFMIVNFDELNVPSENEAGTYAGLLASSFAFGQMISSPLWGWVADRFTVRTVFLTGLSSSIVNLIVFGTAQKFWVAILARTVHGLMSSNLPQARAYLGLTTDDSNRNAAFRFIGVGYGIGLLAGPVFGGLLADPVKAYDITFLRPVFEKFKYLAPCFTLAVLNVGALLAILRYCDVPHSRPRATETLSTSLLDEDNGFSTAAAAAPKSRPSMLSIACRPVVLLLCGSFFVDNLVYYSNVEIIGLWPAASPELGGLGFSPREIGLLLVIAGIFAPMFQFLGYPKIVKRFGLKSSTLFAMGVFILTVTTQGLATFILAKSLPMTWMFLILTEVGKISCIGIIYTGMFVMLNNCASTETRGSIQGIATTWSALARVIGPFFAAFIFSATLNSSMPFPFNFFFVFALQGILMVAPLLMIFFVPRSVENAQPASELVELSSEESI
eukprot:NODE_344_length_1757_cov_136.827283_g279_i0.p1 GENE.NODE_344_length_1757_cov_136.827283_g279_i0~~NODE_344_length_1757_cov_136.827283_g279_i0.p1  ORF type:complete len:481 (-),score=80.19 NODE_344_length_1757_cov_136.827283_g279_i0:172-1614(-)